MKRTQLALSCVLATSWLGCRSHVHREPAPRTPSPAPVTVSAMMHGHLGAVRDIYRALLVDDVETARARARELSRMPAATASEDWNRAARFLGYQANRLARAPDANQARALATETATYCADCHMLAADPAHFRPAPVPPDDGSPAAAMARHDWGAETMWLGVIAPSTDLWREGLRELAASPRVDVAGERAREVAIMNARLTALAEGSSELGGQGDRARRLAEVLDVCAGCHAITRRSGGR